MEHIQHDLIIQGISEIISDYCSKQHSFNKRNMLGLQNRLKAYIAEQTGVFTPGDAEFLLFAFIPSINSLHLTVKGKTSSRHHLYEMLDEFERWTCEITTAFILAA